MTWIATALILLNATLAPISLCVWFPRYTRSRLQYRLWRLRDSLWDTMYSQNLHDNAHAMFLRKRIEESIRSVEVLTVRTALPMLMTLRATNEAALRKVYLRLRREAYEQGRIEKHPSVEVIEKEFGAAISRYLSWTSIPGAFIRTLVAVFIVRKLRLETQVARRREQQVDSTIESRVTTLVSALNAPNSRQRELSNCLS